MKNQTMKNWQGGSVVPAAGFGMGDVRLDAVMFASDAATHTRHAVAVKATPATGFRPWSPPVT